LMVLVCSLACFPSAPPPLHSFPTRRSSDLFLATRRRSRIKPTTKICSLDVTTTRRWRAVDSNGVKMMKARKQTKKADSYKVSPRSEEHTSELQSREKLVCRLLLEKKKRIMQ